MFVRFLSSDILFTVRVKPLRHCSLRFSAFLGKLIVLRVGSVVEWDRVFSVLDYTNRLEL